MKRNGKRYEAPATATMTQIFYDPDKRGVETLKAAKSQKTILNSRAFDAADVNTLGDPFLLQRYYPGRTQAEIARLFGSGFAEAIAGLSEKTWNGPILSGYGVHLVYIHSRQAAIPPKFPKVRRKVLQDWKNEEQKVLSDRYIANLLAKYDVKVEEMARQDPSSKDAGSVK